MRNEHFLLFTGGLFRQQRRIGIDKIAIIKEDKDKFVLLRVHCGQSCFFPRRDGASLTCDYFPEFIN